MSDSIKDGHSSFGPVRAASYNSRFINQMACNGLNYFILMPISSSISPDRHIKSLYTHTQLFQNRKKVERKKK